MKRVSHSPLYCSPKHSLPQHQGPRGVDDAVPQGPRAHWCGRCCCICHLISALNSLSTLGVNRYVPKKRIRAATGTAPHTGTTAYLVGYSHRCQVLSDFTGTTTAAGTTQQALLRDSYCKSNSTRARFNPPGENFVGAWTIAGRIHYWYY